MYWPCDVCDIEIYEQFTDKHLQSGYFKRLANSIIRKYNTFKTNRVGETIAEYLKSHYRKYEKFFALNVVKLLTSSNQIKNIRRHFMCYPSQQRIYDA